MKATIYSSASLILILLLHCVCSQVLPSFGPDDPDKNKGAEEFIKSRGYGVKLHTFVTGDGYIVGMYHVINPRMKATKQPVLFLPVDGGSGFEWCRNSPGGFPGEPLDVVGPNLCFEVAKRGYDVWLLDDRGTAPASINHTTLNADNDLAYWDYSLDELALFDLPGAIDYVRRETKYDKIAVVGIQFSTTMYFFLASRVPRFNQVVQPFIGVEPGFSQFHSGNPKEFSEASANVLKVRRGQVTPSFIFDLPVKLFCPGGLIDQFLCNPVIYLGSTTQFPDGKIGSLNFKRLVVYLSTGPGSESSWQYAQEDRLCLSERITMFDVDPETNLQRYGTTKPPEYFPEQITNPEMHLIYASSDEQCDVKDINNLKQRLGVKVKSEFDVPVEFTGLSFQDGKPEDVSKYVNTPVLDILAQYQ
jgi:lysosomal acid lipase/cholesteryl ester hydrolase